MHERGKGPPMDQAGTLQTIAAKFPLSLAEAMRDRITDIARVVRCREL